MEARKHPSFFVVGLALFSMFFGAGNLIFPLFVGQSAPDYSLTSTVGFLSTAVLLPFLGILSMVVFKGDYPRFFECLGRRLGVLVPALLLTVWIPLGSAPRCITLAYGSLIPYFPMPAFWIFSLLYSGAVYFVIRRKSRALDILGTILTPLLLLCLGILFVQGVRAPSLAMGGGGDLSAFLIGMKEGYNTMDMIAAFFFSASIIELLRSVAKKGDPHPLLTAMKAFLIGISLLGIVYVGLVQLAAQHTAVLEGIPKEQLLSHVAKVIMGPRLGIIAAFAILLACFTTSVALVIVFYEFLMKTKLPWISTKSGAIGATFGTTFAMSIFGLQGITLITAPVLQVCYPFLLGMIVIQLSRKGIQKFLQRRQDGQAAAISATQEIRTSSRFP